MIKVNDLKELLENLSDNGYDDMPIYLGDKTPLLKDAVCIDFSCNTGLHFKNTYYNKELVESANELKNTLDKAVKRYISRCYHAGRNIKPDKEVTNNNKVYLVYGDTEFYEYGSEINVFGIFTNLLQAEKAKTEKEEEYFKNEIKKKFTDVSKRSQVNFKIMEIEIDKIVDEYLGGYSE